MPEEVTIRIGELVIWSNEAKKQRWPASNVHPTHELYPEFDPQAPVAQGESWGFVFERAGTWRYHDHLEPLHQGVVEVTK